ncbi:Conserved_hypothetical protein [Hexamita inflata]|uniref:Uncharacterized protein n=1 Tax=Hexamita inflata TaxID=28002 RepID=A0AA86PUQ5_9EUKA|nr:Conserved hypothetical protein [Hexamita inflata]CAI9941149.1 Conserved hypothetical protein [Hexamita inflata]
MQPRKLFRHNEYYNLCETHDNHLRNVQVLNKKLSEIYGTETLSFGNEPQRADMEVDHFVKSVLHSFIYRNMPILKDPLANPYKDYLREVKTDQDHIREPLPYTLEAVVKEQKPERMEYLKYVTYYSQIEKIFCILEQIKAKFTDTYVPAGAKYFAKPNLLTYNTQRYRKDVEDCRLNTMFTTVYENHRGLALNERLLERANLLLNWTDLIKIEKFGKLILNKKKLKVQVQALSEQGGNLSKVFAVFILEIVRK